MNTKFNQWTQLLYCSELNAIQLRVLMLILNYHNLDNWNNISLSKLQADCGLGSSHTIIKSIKVLEEKGLISKVVSSYKNNIRPTNDYIPNYEQIQEMIDTYCNKCTDGYAKNAQCLEQDLQDGSAKNAQPDMQKMHNAICKKCTTGSAKNAQQYNIINNKKENKIENINNKKEKSKEKKNEYTNNLTMDKPITNSISNFDFNEDESNSILDSKPNNVLNSSNDFDVNPTLDSKPNDLNSKPIVFNNNSNNDSNLTMTSKPTIEEVKKPHRVNLNYIDELEQQFNASPIADVEPTDDTQSSNNPTTAPNQNANNISNEIPTYAHHPLTSDYIKNLKCYHIKTANPTIMFDLVEASKMQAIFIDAMNKSIEWLQTYLSKGMNSFIAEVYKNAYDIINSKESGLSDKQKKYAKDTIDRFKSCIVACGGRELILNSIKAA